MTEIRRAIDDALDKLAIVERLALEQESTLAIAMGHGDRLSHDQLRLLGALGWFRDESIQVAFWLDVAADCARAGDTRRRRKALGKARKMVARMTVGPPSYMWPGPPEVGR